MTAARTYGLGRLVEHDPRSRDFPAMVAAAKPKTVIWEHHATVLDQGSLGSCTGNALTQWLNTDYARGYEFDGLRAPLSEDTAIKLYSTATKMDAFPGTWPPEDTGSSGLAVCKAGVFRGLLTGYRHVFSFTAMLMALQHSPVIVGTRWTEGMYRPDRDNIIRPTGEVVGGHEYLILGADIEHQQIIMLNSWSAAWGIDGRARIPFDSFRGLLSASGDVTVPVL
jgi:hypothetical protein